MAKQSDKTAKIFQTHYTVLAHALDRDSAHPYNRGALNELTTIIQQLGGSVESGVVSFGKPHKGTNVCPHCKTKLEFIDYSDVARKKWHGDHWEEYDGAIIFTCPECSVTLDVEELEKMGVI